MSLADRLRQFRAEEQKLAWEGTFLEYFDMVRERPQVARLAHARIHTAEWEDSIAKKPFVRM